MNYEELTEEELDTEIDEELNEFAILSKYIEEQALGIDKQKPFADEEPKKRVSNKGVSKPREKSAKNDRDYISKEEFYEDIKQYLEAKEIAKAEGRKIKVPDKIGKSMLMIATKIFNSRSFYGSQHIVDDLIYAGVYDAIKGLEKFDLTRKEMNPFGYFSTTIRYAGLRRIQDEVKSVAVKTGLLERWRHNNLDKLDSNNNSVKVEDSNGYEEE